MTYRIVINRDERKLYLYDGGRLVKEYPVGLGRSGLETPLGQWKIVNKQYNPGGPFGTRWMGLSIPGYGIHGTNNPSSIGSYVSHGCIRMHNKDVEELFNKVPIGTLVTIVSTSWQPPQGKIYTVKPGDSLWKISQQFGTSVEELMRINKLSSTLIYPGQQLTVK